MFHNKAKNVGDAGHRRLPRSLSYGEAFQRNYEAKEQVELFNLLKTFALPNYKPQNFFRFKVNL